MFTLRRQWQQSVEKFFDMIKTVFRYFVTWGTTICTLHYLHVHVQWDLRTQTLRITETFTMRTLKWPRSQIIPYSLLYIVTSIKWKPPYFKLRTPNYGHRSHAPMDKINANFPLKTDSLDLNYCYKRVEKYLLLLKTSVISIHSSTFQGLFALKECS